MITAAKQVSFLAPKMHQRNDGMMEARSFTSPRGWFRYPRVGEPDYGNKEYPKKNGEFSVQLVLKQDDAATKLFIAKLQPICDQAIKDGKKAFSELKANTRRKLKEPKIYPLFSELYDDNDKPTGEIAFKFAAPYKVEVKNGPKAGKVYHFRPGVFDANLRPMDGRKVWARSEGVVSFELGLNKEGTPGYFIPGTGAIGLKLKLVGVQVLKLVQGGERDAASMGFEAQEGYNDDGSRVEGPGSSG